MGFNMQIVLLINIRSAMEMVVSLRGREEKAKASQGKKMKEDEGGTQSKARGRKGGGWDNGGWGSRGQWVVEETSTQLILCHVCFSSSKFEQYSLLTFLRDRKRCA